MAGLGRKEWSPGDTLNAADVNGYLMDQSVMVFAGTAARASAIPSPSAGMVAYSTATNLEYYDGSNWESVAVPSGLVPIVPTSVVVGGGSATFSSTTGKITAASATTNLSVNGVFSADYQNYLIQVMITGVPTDVNMRFRVAGTDNSANNYSSVLAKAESGTTTLAVAIANETISVIPSVARTSATTYMSFSNIQVSNAFSSADETAVMIDLIQLGNSQPLATRWFGGSNLNVTTSYDGFSLIIASGSITGNVQVFGYV